MAIDQRHGALQLVATTQRGLFTAQQALECGFDRHTILLALERSRWQEVAPGVLRALPAAPMLAIDELHAATMSATALAARLSTLALCDLAPYPREPHLL